MDVAGLPARLTARLARGRAFAAARHTSRATVRRKTGQTGQSETTGYQVPIWDVIYTDRPIRIGGSGNAATSRTVRVGDGEMQVAVRTASFSAETDDLLDGDLIDITAGELTGNVYQIVEADWQDQATARRVPVVATDRPKEW